MAELEEEEQQQPQAVIDLKQMPVIRDEPILSESEELSDFDESKIWQDMDPKILLKKLKIPLILRRENLMQNF